jgi:RNA polymerase-binding transcription factor DksA
MDDAEYAQRNEDILTRMHLRAKLAEISALQSVPQATECDACGETIPAERRAAVPGCRLCAACKSEEERSATCF